MKSFSATCKGCGKEHVCSSNSIVGDMTYTARLNLPLYWHVLTNKPCVDFGKKKIRGLIYYSLMFAFAGIVGIILEVLRFVLYWITFPFYKIHEFVEMY